jgi:hypothetical protein
MAPKSIIACLKKEEKREDTVDVEKTLHVCVCVTASRQIKKKKEKFFSVYDKKKKQASKPGKE